MAGKCCTVGIGRRYKRSTGAGAEPQAVANLSISCYEHDPTAERTPSLDEGLHPTDDMGVELRTTTDSVEGTFLTRV